MPCNCDSSYKRVLHGEIKLWTAKQEGIPAGTGIVLPTVDVLVCDKCGTAEFKMPYKASAQG
jgi:hypothetical protein